MPMSMVVFARGADMCMVFEMLGDNLLTLIKAFKYKGIPSDIVRKITRSVRTRVQCCL